jgi:hypothetical protein
MHCRLAFPLSFSHFRACVYWEYIHVHHRLASTPCLLLRRAPRVCQVMGQHTSADVTRIKVCTAHHTRLVHFFANRRFVLWRAFFAWRTHAETRDVTVTATAWWLRPWPRAALACMAMRSGECHRHSGGAHVHTHTIDAHGHDKREFFLALQFFEGVRCDASACTCMHARMLAGVRSPITEVVVWAATCMLSCHILWPCMMGTMIGGCGRHACIHFVR